MNNTKVNASGSSGTGGATSAKQDEQIAIETDSNSLLIELQSNLGTTTDGGSPTGTGSATLISAAKGANIRLTSINTAFGGQGDVPATNDTGSFSFVALFKRLLQQIGVQTALTTISTGATGLIGWMSTVSFWLDRNRDVVTQFQFLNVGDTFVVNNSFSLTAETFLAQKKNNRGTFFVDFDTTGGTWSGQIGLSNPSTPSVAVSGNVFYNMQTGAWSQYITAPGQYAFETNGGTIATLRAFSGTFTYCVGNIRASANPFTMAVRPNPVATIIGSVGQSGNWTVQPGNTVNTTPWLVSSRPSPAQGLTAFRIVATASVNNTLVKAGQSSLKKITVYNTSTTVVRYLKLYNKVSAPIAGTDIPVLTLAIPPNRALQQIDFACEGQNFPVGLGYTITEGEIDTDSTPVPALGLYGNILYI